VDGLEGEKHKHGLTLLMLCYDIHSSSREYVLKQTAQCKRNANTDLPPFLTGQSRDGQIYITETGSSIISALLACDSLMDKQVCIKVPPVYTPCTAIQWPADNAEITSLTLSSEKLS
jgi:hypothetical protein